ncbi:thioredoxin domain-containing protein [Spirosoma litoris]
MLKDHPKKSKQEALLPVLLCFMPIDARQHLLVNDILEQLQEKLTGRVQLLKIEEIVHPGVAQSFAVTQLPSFILVWQGIELWRQDGFSSDNLLDLLEQYLPKTS